MTDRRVRLESGGMIDRRLSPVTNAFETSGRQQIPGIAVIARGRRDLASQIVPQSPSDWNIGHAHPQEEV